MSHEYFESDDLKFARMYDQALIDRIMNNAPGKYSKEDVEAASSLCRFADSMVDDKVSFVKSFSRHMVEGSQQPEGMVVSCDIANAWVKVQCEMETINDLRALVSDLEFRLHKHELSNTRKGGTE